MANYPQPLEKRLMATIRALETKVKRLEHLAADPVAIGTQLARVAITSPNYIPGQQGWTFNADGTGEFTTTVDGGVNIAIGTVAPASPRVGDLWFDANNNYVMNQYDGTQWNPYQFGTNALQAGSVNANLIAANSIVAGMIAAGAIDGLTINGVTINGNLINATDILISGVNSGIFVYGGGVGGASTYTVSGSWVCPPNTTTVTVELWAGGAGGGGNGGAQYLISGAGGGAGQYVKYQYAVTPGHTYTFVIGAAGIGGSHDGVDGTAGGNTTFDSGALVAQGGFGGQSGNTGSTGGLGGNATPPGSPIDAQPGGKGGNGHGFGPAGGGGGGGSGAPGLPGLPGQPGTINPGVFGTGGSAQPGGGPGGRGGGAFNPPLVGQPPTIGPGGGGGGAGGDGGGPRAGANGFKGQLRLTWTPTLQTLTGSISGQTDTDPLAGTNVPEGAMFDRVTALDTAPGGVTSFPASSVLYSNSGHNKYASTDGNSYNTGRWTVPATSSTAFTTSMQTVGGLSAALGVGTYRIHAQVLINNPGTASQGAISYRMQGTGGLVASSGRCSIVELFGGTAPTLADYAVLGTTLTGSVPGTGGASRVVTFDGLYVISTAGVINVQISQATTAACNMVSSGSYLEVMPVV